MKSILVIDTPKDCEDCPLNSHTEYDFDVCWITQGKGDCPLKPLPDPKDIGYPNDDYDVGFGDGWDACLNEIEK